MYMESIVEVEAVFVPWRGTSRPRARRLKPWKVFRNYAIFAAIVAMIVAFWAAFVAGLMLLLPLLATDEAGCRSEPRGVISRTRLANALPPHAGVQTCPVGSNDAIRPANRPHGR